jgi:hypothetical protein
LFIIIRIIQARGIFMSTFSGSWKLVELENDDISLCENDLLKFSDIENKRGSGYLKIATLEADLDCRFKTVHKRPFVDFSMQGEVADESLAGRGYALLKTDTMMEGTIIIHKGEEFWFVARKIS